MSPQSSASAKLLPLAQPRWTWTVLAIVVVLGLFARFVSVQDLSFYGDEETTAFAALALHEDGAPAMPSGMAYNRAPLYSLMASAAVMVFGPDAEMSYRLPALLFGSLAVVFIGLGSWRALGPVTAGLSVLLLASSEWHTVTSGYARMYSPYLALFLVTAFAFLQWSRARQPGWLVAGVVLFVLASSFQILTVFVLALLVLRHLVRPEPAGRLLADVALAGGLLVVAIYFDGLLVQGAYTEFAVSMDGHQKATVLGNVAIFWLPKLTAALTGWQLLPLLVGGAGAAYLVWRLPFISLAWNLAVAVLAAALVLFTALGQFYAVLLVLYLLALLERQRGVPLPQLALMAVPVLLLTALLALPNAQSSWLAQLADPDEQMVFPYLAQLAVKYPLLVVLALAAPFTADALRLVGLATAESLEAATQPSERRQWVVILAFFLVANMLAFGLIGQWYEDRYIVHTYPFLLLLAACSLTDIGRSLLARWSQVWVLPALLTLGCLLLPHHLAQGLYRGWQKTHGAPNIENSRYFPDHRSVGQAVQARLQPGDIVVATDVLQQRWYAGQADYWLRSLSDAARYVYAGADGKVRDIYVHSEHLGPDRAEELLTGTQRVWFIVSSIDLDEDWAFSPFERDVLQQVEQRAELVAQGRDGRARAYLLTPEHAG